MTTKDLGVSIIDMPFEQALALVQSIRLNRRVSKKVFKSKGPVKLPDLNSFTPEQAGDLLQLLEGI